MSIKDMLLRDLASVRRGKTERGDDVSRVDDAMAIVRSKDNPAEWLLPLNNAGCKLLAHNLINGTYAAMVVAAQQQPKPAPLPPVAAEYWESQ